MPPSPAHTHTPHPSPIHTKNPPEKLNFQVLERVQSLVSTNTLNFTFWWVQFLSENPTRREANSSPTHTWQDACPSHGRRRWTRCCPQILFAPKREDKMKIVEEEGKKSEIWEVQRREVQRKGGPSGGFRVWGLGFGVQGSNFWDKNRNRTKRK